MVKNKSKARLTEPNGGKASKIPKPRMDNSIGQDKSSDSSNSSVENNERNNGPREYIPSQARFVYIKSEAQGIVMTKANPFRVTEALRQAVGGDVKKVKPLKSGDLLVETYSKEQVESLCDLRRIGELRVRVVVAKQFNIARGLIYAPSLITMDEEEIVEALRDCNVTHAKFLNKGPARIRTPLIVLTFSASTLPAEITCGYLNVKVDKYIPPPLRCFKCNGFGHTASVCNKEVMCTRCAENHKRDECINMDIKCSNCNSTEHGALDKLCPVFIKEKEIVTVKVCDNLSYFEARKRVEGKSYAAAACGGSGNGGADVKGGAGPKSRFNVSGHGNSSDSNGPGVSGVNTRVMNESQSEVEMEVQSTNGEHGASGMNVRVRGNVEVQENQDEVAHVLSLVTNLAKIINRNPNKLTIQARQISNFIYKISNRKLDVGVLIQALQ